MVLVCKLRDTPYRSGKTEFWVKVKCTKRGSFAVIGFVQDREVVAALHLAKREGRSLVYVGKAGTGFSRKVSRDLHRLLLPLATGKPMLAVPGRHPKTVWVRAAIKRRSPIEPLQVKVCCGTRYTGAIKMMAAASGLSLCRQNVTLLQGIRHSWRANALSVLLMQLSKSFFAGVH